MKLYYDRDADLNLLKQKVIAVIGYGSQGHAQAQNLRDSGLTVVVGEIKGTANYDAAVADGFQPVTAEEASLPSSIEQTSTPFVKCVQRSAARGGEKEIPDEH